MGEDADDKDEDREPESAKKSLHLDKPRRFAVDKENGPAPCLTTSIEAVPRTATR